MEKICYDTYEQELIIKTIDYPCSIGSVIHLSIERTDGKEICEKWNFFQNIKNKEFGNDSQMVEVYPKEENLVNHANIRHFFVLPKNYIIPFTTK